MYSKKITLCCYCSSTFFSKHDQSFWMSEVHHWWHSHCSLASWIILEDTPITVSSHLTHSKAPFHSILLKGFLMTSSFCTWNMFIRSVNGKFHRHPCIYKVLAGNHTGILCTKLLYFSESFLFPKVCVDCYWWNWGHFHQGKACCFYLHWFLACAAHQGVIVRISCGTGKACNLSVQTVFITK